MKTGNVIKLGLSLLALALVLAASGAYAVGPAGVNSGIVTWLDASGLGLANGALVTTWPDQSGVGNNATAYTWADYQPEYITDAINGLGVIRFGSYAKSQLYLAAGILNPNMTLFMVYKNRTPAYGKGIITLGGVEYMDWGGGWATCQQVNTWESRLAGPYVPNAVFGVETICFNGATSFVKLNGANGLAAAPYDGTGDMTYTNFNNSGLTRIGARNNAIDGAAVDIAEIVIYNRVLSADEENNVGAYLESKYALTTAYEPVAPPDSGVQGVVTNAHGAFVDGATVEVVGGTQSTATDSAGAYELPLAAGAYTIKITKSGYGVFQQSVTVDAHAYTTLDVTMPPLPGIYGLVTASNITGNPPVIGALVRALGTSSETYTGSDGRYYLVVPSGTYEVEASKDHYGALAQELTVDDSTNQTLDFALEHDGTWDLATDYSTVCNPMGQWSLGVVNESSNVIEPFTQQSDNNSNAAGGAKWLWSYPNSPWVMDGWAGAVGKNILATPISIPATSNPSNYVEPGDIILHGGGGFMGGNHPGICSIRWTAPDARTIHIYLKASSKSDAYINWLGNPTVPALPVSVRRNNVPMAVVIPNGFVGRAINGYSDSVGPAPVVEFATDIPVAAGDTIDFSLGQYGYGDLNRWTWNATWSMAGIVAQISPGSGYICNNIADIKARNVGDTVFLTTPVQMISSSRGDWSFDKKFNAAGSEMSLYVQSDDRMQGIKCLADANITLYNFSTTPWKLTFTGKVDTDYLGKKVVRILSINSAAAGIAPAPIGKGGKALAKLGSNPAEPTNTLVKVWGKVTQIVNNPIRDTETWTYGDPVQTYYKWDYEYIVINDGSQDIKIPLHVQANYMSSFDFAISNIAVGKYIAVTGIAGTTNGSDIAVYPRNVADIAHY